MKYVKKKISGERLLEGKHHGYNTIATMNALLKTETRIFTSRFKR